MLYCRILLLLFLFPIRQVLAQGPPPPPSVPVDTGLSLLLIAVMAFALTKAFKYRKKSHGY
jgi:hypothetical protein